jgi:succinyl-CoA synthetase beta subunit
MARLTEDLAKRLLAQAGVPIPAGQAVSSPGAAAVAAEQYGGAVAVKALIPSGRRGRARGVRFASTPAEAAEMAAGLLGTRVLEHFVERVYVEEQHPPGDELFLSISFDPTARAPIVLASRHGGGEIEEVVLRSPELLVAKQVDYQRGLLPHHALALWDAAGLHGDRLVPVARLTAQLYRSFVTCDASLLEANPIMLTPGNAPVVVGAMLDIDDSAFFRLPAIDGELLDGGQGTPRERAVWRANRDTSASGSVRYIELPGGDLGLCCAGGGAGLYQFDRLVKAGALPANYTDISPGDLGEKLRALLTAAITKPGVRGLLFSINIMQLGRVDVYTQALVDVLEREHIDPLRFPIVVRLAGLREAEGAAFVRGVPGLRLHTDDVTLDEAVAEIVELMRPSMGPRSAGA